MSQFGGSPREDDYGFFAPAKPSGSGGQFGGPPAAGSQFGSAAPSSGANPGFGAPTSTGFDYAPPPTYTSPEVPRSGLGKGRAIGLLGLAAVVIVVGWFGWRMTQLSKPVQVPATLAGLPEASDPQFEALILEASKGVQEQNPGMAADAAAYGDKDQLVVLVIIRGKVSVDREFNDFSTSSGVKGLSGRQNINGASCVADAAGTLAFCLRTSSTLTVEVATVGQSINDAANAVQEAWRLQ